MLYSDITFGSVCSGIEAASVAWEPLGWRAAWLADVDKFANAVTAHHYPEVQNLGDMTALPAMVREGRIEAPALLTPSGGRDGIGVGAIAEMAAMHPVAYVKATSPHSADEAPRYEQTEVAACLNTWDERHNPPKHMAVHPIGFQTRGSNLDVGDISGTIGTNADRASGFAPVAIDTYNQTEQDTAHTICAGAGMEGVPATYSAMQVRRLTPRECERLQGFPDDYTLIPWRGKLADQCPDGPRYKALGNSWAVPVVRWIGRRIDAAIKKAQQ